LLGVLSEKLARFAIRRSGLILVAAGILAVLSAFGASRLRLNPEITAFLPANNRAVADFRRIVDALGTIDHHVVLITVPRGSDANAYEPLVDAVASGYERLPFVESVEWRLPDPESIIETLLPHVMLLLTPRELDQVANRLTDDAIREVMAENAALLQTPQSSLAKELVRLDPLKLRSVLLQRVTRLGGNMRFDPASRHVRSKDGATWLILVRPKHPAQDVPFANQLMASARVIERRVVASQPLAPPQFEYAGGYAITHADAQVIRDDMIVNVLVSFFGVLFLFALAFRRFAPILYATAPMLLAIVVTFGVAFVVLGELGAASAGFAALLAGLGIDFMTVLYGRFIEERLRGGNVETALRETYRSTLPGVIVAALTTAATFYGFLFTDFRGMAQMGFLTGTGILLFLLTVVFLFPAMAVRLERDGGDAPRTFLHLFGMSALVRASIRKPRWTIAAWIAFVLVMAMAATRIEFNDDAGRLRPRGNAGIVAHQRLSAAFGRGGDPIMIVAEAPTAADAMRATEEIVPTLERLTARKQIAGFESMATLLPSPARQNAIIAALRARNNDTFSGRRITATFRGAAIENGFRPEIWNGWLESFTAALAPTEPLLPSKIGDPQLQRLAEWFLKQANGRWMSVVYIHPPNGRWPDGVPPELQAIAKPGVTVTGITAVSAQLRRIARADAVRATIIGSIIILTILIVGFRSLGRALLVFVPYIAGATGMLGAMALLRLELNLMNIFIILMIVGVATDYAVYMLQRYREAPDAFAQLAPETGKAVAMAAATAILGYGSFALSHYPGLQSIGYAATFGIGLSCLGALTLLPAMLVRGNARPATTPEP
jgi:predicted RND superfamily exporter protein